MKAFFSAFFFSFQALKRITFNVHVSSIQLKTLPASTHCLVPKLHPHLWVFVTAAPHFSVPESACLLRHPQANTIDWAASTTDVDFLRVLRAGSPRSDSQYGQVPGRTLSPACRQHLLLRAHRPFLVCACGERFLLLFF